MREGNTMRFGTWKQIVLQPLVLLLVVACQSSRVELKPFDRMVFFGDSITELGDQPGGYVSLVRDELRERHPDLSLEVIGAGISGNKVPDLEERLPTDVLAKQPTIVFVYIGINDVWHSTMAWGGTPRDRYAEGLRSILTRITQTGSQVLLCTPSVIGEHFDGTNPLDTMLDEYAAISRRVARELRVPLVDLRREFLRYLEEHNPDNAENGILTTDGVHLNEAGNRLVMRAVLRALGERNPE